MMDKKEEIAREIRNYSMAEITLDYLKLCEIGHDAIHQSPKKLTGNKVVDAWTFPERLNTASKKGKSFYEYWDNREAYMEKGWAQRFIEKSREKCLVKQWYSLYRFQQGSINCFRPLVAMEYYSRFSPRCILDPTMGWGGRLVGAAALNVPKYIGIDNNPALREPYANLCKFLSQHSQTEMDIRIQDCLTVDYSTMEYDMVFTSPPYYNLELYGGNRERRSKEDWDTELYIPLFENTYKYLQPGGHYCLNVCIEIFNRVLHPLFGEPTYIIPLKKGNKNKEKAYSEYVYIWKK